MSAVDEAFEQITNEHTEDELFERLDELRLQYVDQDQADDYGLDPQEWYNEFGRGEAEDDLVAELLDTHDVSLSDDQIIELIERLHRKYRDVLGFMQ